jgi:two-component sensor histidine kinase
MSGEGFDMSKGNDGASAALQNHVAAHRNRCRSLAPNSRSSDLPRYDGEVSRTIVSGARPSQFEQIASAATSISIQRVKLLGILLAAASPALWGGPPVLRPIWATEAMHRAHNIVRLVARLEQRVPRCNEPSEEQDFETKVGVELASMFDSLAIDRDLDPRACSWSIRDVARNLIELFGPGVGHIDLTTSVERLALPAFQHRALILMASELITNSLLHAFENRSTGCMTLRLDRPHRGLARLTVTDDGRGLSGSAPHRPAACSVISDLAHLLQSELTYRPAAGGGTIAEIDIPLQEAPRRAVDSP